jgi:O-antigen/teichoic acid export membrane protein
LLLLATVELAAGGLVFWQVVTHLFAPTEVGRASVLISASTLIGNLALLGMNNSLVRYLPEWPDRARTVSTGMTLVAAVAAAGGLGVGIGMRAVVPEASVHGAAGVAVFTALTVAGAVSLFVDNVFVALRRTGHVLGRNTLMVVLRLALPPVLLGLHAYGIFTAYWLPAAAALLLYLLVLRHSFGLRLRLRVSTDRLRAMWRFSAGTYAATMILTMPTLLMPVLVAHRVDPAHAAYYYIASLLSGVLAFVPQATTRSLFAEAAHDPGRLREHLARVLQVTAALQVPLLAVLLAAGREVLGLFGPVYRQAYPLLALLALSAALSSVGFVGSTLLLISGRLRLLCQLSAAASAVCLLGAYLLAGRGLAWVGGSVLAAEAVLATVYTGVIAVALRHTVDTPAGQASAS